jgi:hypothetical protein
MPLTSATSTSSDNALFGWLTVMLSYQVHLVVRRQQTCYFTFADSPDVMGRRHCPPHQRRTDRRGLLVTTRCRPELWPTLPQVPSAYTSDKTITPCSHRFTHVPGKYALLPRSTDTEGSPWDRYSWYASYPESPFWTNRVGRWRSHNSIKLPC